MAVQLLDKAATIPVTELLSDDRGVEAEDVEGVPAEVVAGSEVERGVLEASGDADAVPVVGAA